ncbi:MAG: CoA transferase [Chloroflexi bacterium]|nr:CoA transferase [Chloroflexota bacterium]
MALLRGLRVADFTWAWAGPTLTLLLSDWGAEVIKIESSHRVDIERRLAPFPNGLLDINRSGRFWGLNRGKLGCTVNLATLQGRELAKKIVLKSDVVVENFSPGVMARLGLDYGSFRSLKPDLVYVSLSGFGNSGPQSGRAAYGAHLAYESGFFKLTGTGEGTDGVGIQVPYADPAAGTAGCAAVLAALRYRSRTGVGQYIDVAQLDTLVSLMPTSVVASQVLPAWCRQRGNEHEGLAPHGCYPCQGQDEWIAIAVQTDEQWQALAAALDAPELADHADFATAAQRWANRKALDALLALRTRDKNRWQLAGALQRAGVPATGVYTSADLLHDKHLRERSFFADMAFSPAVAQISVPGMPAHVDGEAAKSLPAPDLGQHNEYVFRELLGLSEQEIYLLSDAGGIE